MMAGLGHARLGNVMTYGFDERRNIWARKDTILCLAYNGRVGYQILCLFYTYHAS